MNAPRDPWDDFAEVFHDELASNPLTPEQMDAMADEYQQAAIDGAHSIDTPEGYEPWETK